MEDFVLVEKCTVKTTLQWNKFYIPQKFHGSYLNSHNSFGVKSLSIAEKWSQLRHSESRHPADAIYKDDLSDHVEMSERVFITKTTLNAMTNIRCMRGKTIPVYGGKKRYSSRVKITPSFIVVSVLPRCATRSGKMIAHCRCSVNWRVHRCYCNVFISEKKKENSLLKSFTL